MYNQRQQQLIAMLTEAGSLRVLSIAEKLNVTGATIRNDLRFLEKQGVVERIHGGVTIRPDYLAKKKYAVFSDVTQPIHQTMAEWALTKIKDKDAIFLDDCGTASYLVPLLEERNQLKVFTNGIHIASALAHNEQHEVYLVGGRVSSNGRRILNNIGCDMLSAIHLHTAFVSPDGFSTASGMTQNDFEVAKAKISYLNLAAQVIALVEAERFERDAVASIVAYDGIDSLVTDADVDQETITKLQQAGMEIVICTEDEIREYPGTRKQKTWKIGFANLDDNLPFCNQVRLSLEDAARQQETELIVCDNQLDIKKALEIADELIDADVDLVIEYQIFESLGGVIMNKLRSADIPVIAVDIPMVGATYFGGDNYTAGKLAGEALGTWINVNWEGVVDYVLMLEDQRTGDMVASRLFGQLEGLRKKIELAENKVIHIDCANQPEITGTNVTQWFLAHRDLHKIAIICHNDDASYGAIKAVRALDREDDVAIVGQGCDRNIRHEIRREDSRIIGSTAWWPEKYGPELQQLAMKILKGEQIPPAIHLTHVFIDRDNIEQYYPLVTDDMKDVPNSIIKSEEA